MPRKNSKQVATTLNEPSALPSGFKEAAVEGGFAHAVDFEKNPVVMGKLVSIRVVNKGTRKENEVMTIETKEGNQIAVWNSYQLSGICQKKNIGHQVFIKFLGYQPMKGNRNPMKVFQAAVK